MKTINEIKAPNVGDEINNILLHIEPASEMAKPDGVFKKGKGFVVYTGPTMFRQTIRTQIVLSNGQTFENSNSFQLPENEKGSFLKDGFFKKVKNNWVQITKKEYYGYF